MEELKNVVFWRAHAKKQEHLFDSSVGAGTAFLIGVERFSRG
jgi:hypothetical protein